MTKKEYYIENLNLTPHPEGGYYSQNYKNPMEVTIGENKRPLSTSIYFLLGEKDKSNFHKLKSDEIWFFQDGSPLDIYMIDQEGKLEVKTLGLDIENGQSPQIVVEAGKIFGSMMNKDKSSDYSLVGCVVSYGFDFEDFTLYKRHELINMYKEHEEIITMLTKE